MHTYDQRHIRMRGIYLTNESKKAGESLDLYITVVMTQADLCTHGNLRDKLIHDRLVSGIRDDRTREKKLNRKDINLARTIELLKSSKATQHLALDMATIGHEASSLVQVVKTNPQHKVATQGNRMDKVRSLASTVARTQIFQGGMPSDRQGLL